MQIYAITEQRDGTYVVTERGRVLVSVFDRERRLDACLDRIVSEAGSSWAAIMTPSGMAGADALLDALSGAAQPPVDAR